MRENRDLLDRWLRRKPCQKQFQCIPSECCTLSIIGIGAETGPGCPTEQNRGHFGAAVMNDLGKTEHCFVKPRIVTMHEHQHMPLVFPGIGEQTLAKCIAFEGFEPHGSEIAGGICRSTIWPLDFARLAHRWNRDRDLCEARFERSFAGEPQGEIIAGATRRCDQNIDNTGDIRGGDAPDGFKRRLRPTGAPGNEERKEGDQNRSRQQKAPGNPDGRIGHQDGHGGSRTRPPLSSDISLAKAIGSAFAWTGTMGPEPRQGSIRSDRPDRQCRMGAVDPLIDIAPDRRVTAAGYRKTLSQP